MQKAEAAPSIPVVHVLPAVILSNIRFLASTVMMTLGVCVLLYLPHALARENRLTHALPKADRSCKFP